MLALLQRTPDLGRRLSPSDLRWRRVSGDGSGSRPGPSDRVTVDYTGTFIDGTEFDRTARQGAPTTFALNRVIKGWQEGVQQAGVGDTIELAIPQHLAYGPIGRRGIPAGRRCCSPSGAAAPRQDPDIGQIRADVEVGRLSGGRAAPLATGVPPGPHRLLGIAACRESVASMRFAQTRFTDRRSSIPRQFGFSNILFNDISVSFCSGVAGMKMMQEVQDPATGMVELPAAEFLKRKMALAGLNASTLAKDLGVHAQTLYNVTTGKRPISPALAVKLAKRFVEPAETWLSDPIKVTAADMLEMALSEKRSRGRGQNRSRGPTLFDVAPAAARSRTDRILVDAEIRELLLDSEDVHISPFDPNLIQPASYDLTVGLIIQKGFRELSEHDWVLVLKLESGQTLQSSERQYIEAQIERKKNKIKFTRDPVELGQLKSVVILTRELVRFGADFMAEVGSTASNAMHGLLVTHGSQVDPGYSGPMYVSAMNILAEAFTLSVGQKILTLTLRQLARAPEKAYRDDIDKRVLKITNRIDAGLKRNFTCRQLPGGDGWMAEGAMIEGGIHGQSEDDALARAVQTAIAALDHADDSDLGGRTARDAVKDVLHNTTLDRAEAQALLEFLYITDEDEKQSVLKLFSHTEDRQRLGYIISRLAIDEAMAVNSMFNGEAFGL